MKDKDKQQDDLMSRRDMLKRVASYTVFTAVTMHVLAPKAQAQGSPSPDSPGGLNPSFGSQYNSTSYVNE